MARNASLSGFPEWLPEERLVEAHVLDTLRRTFELHGFSSIETRAVETVGHLLRKGRSIRKCMDSPGCRTTTEIPPWPPRTTPMRWPCTSI